MMISFPWKRIARRECFCFQISSLRSTSFIDLAFHLSVLMSFKLQMRTSFVCLLDMDIRTKLTHFSFVFLRTTFESAVSISDWVQSKPIEPAKCWSEKKQQQKNLSKTRKQINHNSFINEWTIKKTTQTYHR